MPVPTCMGMECTPASRWSEGWPLPSRSVSPKPAASPHQVSPRVAKKSHQHLEGLEQVVSRLMQQQATLQSICALQEDLRSLVLQQHQTLEKRLADFTSVPVSSVGDKIECNDLAALSTGCPNAMDNEVSLGTGGTMSTGLQKMTGEERAAQPPDPKVVNKISSRASRASTPGGTPEMKEGLMGRLKEVMLSPVFDLLMGVVLMLYFVVVFAELEWKGNYVGHLLGLRPESNWEDAEDIFTILDQVFNVVYATELVARLVVFRLSFFRSAINILDGTIVLVTSVQSFILDPMVYRNEDSSRIMTLMRLLRMARGLRVLRFMRFLRIMSIFSALRVLIKTITMSLDSLIWSMTVVSVIVVSSALLMVQLISGYVEDDSISLELRQWMYRYFGSPAKASYSMFEATFSAKWATHLARPLIEDVSAWFSLFWILYTVTVNFAVLRVIAALFLKQTMAVAAIDAERIAIEKMQEREHVVSTLRSIFKRGDKMGDGVLHKWEFEEMMEDNEVLRMFKSLELEPMELYMLYDLLSEDDGVVDQEEFLSGAMKLKNNARTVDMIQVLHEQTVTKRSIEVIKDGLERLDTVLHPSQPWKARRDFGLFKAHKSKDTTTASTVNSRSQ